MKKTLIIGCILLGLVAQAKPSQHLIDALCQVESNGKALAIGDAGQAYGILQIHQAVVDDVNRIANRNYKHEDSFNPNCARVICSVYLNHYGKLYTKKTGKKPSDEVYARIWNGGPTGWNKKYTKRYANTTKYWNKVQKYL